RARFALPFRYRTHEPFSIGAAGRAFLDDRVEAAHDHALAVERHALTHFGHARVAHELLVRGVAGLPIWIFEEREDDLLVGLGIDRLAEVGDLAFGHVTFPGFDHSANDNLLNQRCEIGRLLFVGRPVALGDGDDETFEIGHAAAPSG